MSWWEAAASIGGKVADTLIGVDSAKRQEYAQREFAKHGIRWKVADAKAAGLHPLAALGASGAAYSPVSSAGSDLGSVGQDISRSIEATRTADERRMARSAQEAELALRERVGAAQAAMYEAQANLANSQAHQLNFVGPPMPTARSGAGSDPSSPEQVIRRDLPREAPPGLWKVKPAEVQSGQPGAPGTLAGPASPSERIIDFRGQKIRIPNVDLDSLLEEPIASTAILVALNPGLSQQLIQEFLKRTGIVQPWKRSPAPSLRRGGGASGSW